MFAVLDKPAGLTSRDAVDHAQTWFPRTKLGHAGTLDPAATGVLVVAVGPTATRLIEYVQRQDKVYRTTFHLGATSTTDDADGEIARYDSPRDPPSRDQVECTLRQFLGTIEQVPPAYSAAKVQGVRAYTKARRGEEVALAPRPVTIHRIDVLRYDYPELDLEITCGKGTYIRSLARDLGQRLGIGGYVSTLRRTRTGPFTLDHAIPWDTSPDQARSHMLPLLMAITDLPRLELTAAELTRLRQGQVLPIIQPLPHGDVALLFENSLAGLATYDPARRLLRALKMFSDVPSH
jgi:tRNA pseudouridine55 synthase